MLFTSQVCTFEQAVKLKELRVHGFSVFEYYISDQYGHVLRDAGNTGAAAQPSIYPAYTTAELGEMLFWAQKTSSNAFYPNAFMTEFADPNKLWVIGTKYPLGNTFPVFHGSSQAEVYAALLIHLIDMNKIDVTVVNDRLKMLN